MSRNRRPKSAAPKVIPPGYRPKAPAEEAAAHLWGLAETLGRLGLDARDVLGMTAYAEFLARKDPALPIVEKIKRNPRILEAPSVRWQIYRMATDTESEANRKTLEKVGKALAARRGRDLEFKSLVEREPALATVEQLMMSGIPEKHAMEMVRQTYRLSKSLGALRMLRSRLKEKQGRKTLPYRERGRRISEDES